MDQGYSPQISRMVVKMDGKIYAIKPAQNIRPFQIELNSSERRSDYM